MGYMSVFSAPVAALHVLPIGGMEIVLIWGPQFFSKHIAGSRIPGFFSFLVFK
jgi:hypothetical protein